MRALVRPRTVTLCLLAALAVGACGKEIGDTCQLATDCDPDGSRYCDTSAPDNQGYCTIMGCDYNTCPSEAECVVFNFGEFANEPCDPATEGMTGSGGTHACNPDETCVLDGHCAPVSAEVRYCMRKCNTDSDCRTPAYECRSFELMIRDGGEVVLAPGDVDSTSTPGFCAPAPGQGSG
jgi:hypothetical protein